MTSPEEAFRALDQGDLPTADTRFRQLLAREPENGRAWWGLARIATLTGERDQAIKLYALCCKYFPTEPAPLIALGEALSLRNRFDEAGTAFNQAVLDTPRDAAAQYALGAHLTAAGNLPGAETHLRTALDLQPTHAHAWEALTRIRTFQAGDASIQKIERLLAKSGGSVNDKIALQYALGKVYDDLDIPEKAFAMWSRANELQLSTCSFRVSDMRSFFAKLMETFNKTLLQTPHFSQEASITPIFIVGQARSGSTLLEQLLTNHSQINSVGETGYLANEIATEATRLTGKSFPACCAQLTPDQSAALGAKYLSFLARYNRGASHMVDKLPSNFQSVGMIRQILPHAHIVHLSRPPVDNCFSIFRHHFVSSEPFFCTLPEIVVYRGYYKAVMAHWHKVLPGFVTELSYLSLSREPKTTMQSLLQTLRLEWEPACEKLPIEPAHISTLSNTQARARIYRDSGAAANRYGEYLKLDFSEA